MIKNKIFGQPAGYKKIYGGTIPKDWNLSMLGILADINYGISDPIDTTLTEGIKIISLPNINKHGEFVLDEIPFVDKAKVKNTDILKEGDLLFNWRNGSVTHLAKTAYFNLEGEFTHVGFLLRIRSDRSKLDPFFLKSYINFLRNKGFFLGAKIQVNNTFNKEELSELPIMHPPLPEQKAIAKVLATWDKAIEKTQELIKLKEQRKKYLMLQLLTGKKRLKGYKGEWKKHSYSDLLKVVKRPVKWNDDELYELISVRRRSGGIFLREALYGKQILVKDLRTALEGDFLFSKMQIVHGASALVTKEFNGAKISGSYIAVVPKDLQLLDIEYFSWYSKLSYFYHQSYISSYGVHIEKMTFDFDNFLTLHINLPSIYEQKTIVRILSKVEVEISFLTKQLEIFQLQKKGLTQVLLTGKKRVKTDK